ncbi:hypothetical protein IM538_21410 [Cytobacillus suaedae]|nr:hypothetical protein IM538_21410 [Cytobacillus suaedae]
MRKLLTYILIIILSISIFPLTTLATNSTDTNCEDYKGTTKVMWDGVELKYGQIGRLLILEDTPLFKLEGEKKIFSRTLKKGELYRIYAFKPGLLNVGGGYFVDRDKKVKYDTPSKSKLRAVQCIHNNISGLIQDFNKEAIIDNLARQEYYKHSSTLATLNIFNPGGSGGMNVSVDLTNDNDMYIKIRAWEDTNIPESKIIPEKVKSALYEIIPSGSAHIYKITEQVAKTGSHQELNKTFTYNGLKTTVKFINKSHPEIRIIFSK